MRRSEFLFRIGGDEFGFVLQDNEPGVLGFLNRLHKATITSVADEIRELLGDERFSLDFHAGITPILPGSDAEHLIDQGFGMCRAAKTHEFNMRAVWPSLARAWGGLAARLGALEPDIVRRSIEECMIADFENQARELSVRLGGDTAALIPLLERDKENVRVSVQNFFVADS